MVVYKTKRHEKPHTQDGRPSDSLRPPRTDQERRSILTSSLETRELEEAAGNLARLHAAELGCSGECAAVAEKNLLQGPEWPDILLSP